MIKQLRKRFIFIAMSSFFIVVFLIVGLTSLSYYVKLKVELDENLDVIIENLDLVENPAYEWSYGGKDTDKPVYKNQNKEGKDTIDEILSGVRFFTVTFNKEGDVTAVNTRNTNTVDETEAVRIASNLYQRHKTGGYCEYRKYCTVEKGDNTIYVFINSKRRMISCITLIKNNVFSALIELLVLIFPVWFFSGYVVRPVKESYEKQKTFITNAGHEIKTPLTIIDANTDVIELTTGESEWTRSTRNQIKRLSKLTEQLIMLTKLEEFEKLSQTDKVILSDMVTEVCEQFETVADKHNKQLKADIDPALMIQADADMLERMFSILLDNAVKYADDSTMIFVSLKKTGKNIVFEIENHATGMKKGKHDELFERFYRADSSRNSATGGYGIGLSAAKTIAELHKGRITAHSAYDGIIKFQIFLKI